VRKLVEAYQQEARAAGRTLRLGESVGVLHSIYFAGNKTDARKLGDSGMIAAFREFFHHFGFSDAWREDADEARYPRGKVSLPASEVTTERLERVGFAYTGRVDDVRREIDGVVENVHPEWFVWQGDQGLLPLDTVKRQIETFGKELIPRYK
jgi:hypothetical protein